MYGPRSSDRGLFFQLEDDFMKRHKMNGQQSRKLFTKTAKGAHPRNYQGAPMRGGIRL